jgi:hypothetical protein
MPAADTALVERSISRVRPAEREAWDRDVAAGAGYTVDEALEEAERPSRPRGSNPSTESPVVATLRLSKPERPRTP